MTLKNRLALHTWTLDTTPLPTALDAAKAAGFDAAEIRRLDFTRCFDLGWSNAQVIEAIQASGIPVGILGTEYGWFFTKGDEQKRQFDVLRDTCRNAIELGCSMIMSAPGQVVGTVAQAIESTRIAGDIVGEFGLKLALEFNSQHDVVNGTHVLREILDGANRASCGMLLDAYHLQRGGGIASGLRGVTAEELFVFQYSDVPVTPSAGVRRPVDRLAPGDGVVDWPALFARLDEIGYAGYLSYEAPNPAIWERSPYEIAVEGMLATRRLLAASGQ
jgi:2-keto-myo-inositol isomerase